MNVTEWLLDSDPAVKWQVMSDLKADSADSAAAERARVALEGWGPRLLALQDDDGYWAVGAYFPADTSDLERGEDGRLVGQPWTATAWSLTMLRLFGLDPESEQARTAVDKVNGGVVWEYDGSRFFDGEVEPCVNGVTVAIGSYFGVDVSGLVDRLLSEQMDDGGWNCEQENGSARGSFHTTIAVLEGLLEFKKRHGPSPMVDQARERGEEYLLERRLMRRLSDGKLVNEEWTLFSFPTWWHYDVLRGLDYLRQTRPPEERVSEALALVHAKRGSDGRWLRQKVWPGAVHFDIDSPEGEPSRWNTLRALRVVKWAEEG